MWSLSTSCYKSDGNLYYKFRESLESLATAHASLTERGAGFGFGLARLPFKVNRRQGVTVDLELAAQAAARAVPPSFVLTPAEEPAHGCERPMRSGGLGNSTVGAGGGINDRGASS